MSTQSVLSSLCSTSQTGNVTPEMFEQTSTSAGGSSYISGLLSMVYGLLAFSPLPNWLNLVILSGLTETLRRFFFNYWDTTVGSFWMTAQLDSFDSSYDWILFWLSKQAVWQGARDVMVSTADLDSASPRIQLDETVNSEGKVVQYIPAAERTYSLWYRKRYVTISWLETRSRIGGAHYSGSDTKLQIRILTRDRSLMSKLIEEAKALYKNTADSTTRIYMGSKRGGWFVTACRSARRMRTVILDPGMKETLLSDCRDFLASSAWYSDRGIPFRRGYLLYGAPGTGKTSLIHSLAGELGLNVYVISLSRAGMDDSSLNHLISQLPERCIALMEDVDAAFPSAVMSRSAPQPTPRLPKLSDGYESDDAMDYLGLNNPAPSCVTLSGLLNALDGIGAHEGRILFATTNHFSSLDPALRRPGRLDVHIEFKLASRYQAKELFKFFYSSFYDDKDKSTISKTDTVGSSAESDSGHSRPSSPVSNPVPVCEKPESCSLYSGDLHNARIPTLSPQTAEELATQFADAVPEHKFSMATLQGYLMLYKVRPHEAVSDFSAWAEEELAKNETATSADSFPKTPSAKGGSA